MIVKYDKNNQYLYSSNLIYYSDSYYANCISNLCIFCVQFLLNL